jgi:signal transduction histidine kinase
VTQPSSLQRADFVLTTAIALVAFLVLGLVLVLNAGSRVYEEANAQRAVMRNIRGTLIDYTEAQNDAVSARRSYLIRGDRNLIELYTTSKAEAAVLLGRLRDLNTAEAGDLAIVSRLEDLSGQLFANLDQGFNSRTVGRLRDTRTAELTEAIEQEVAALHASVIQRSDVIRRDEEKARGRVDSTAGVLALLSLLTCTLAILALRRERKQWRLATEAAEEARAKAAASDLAKTRFLAVASHDMRQPLHALTLYLSALERRVDTPEAKDIIAKMDRATQSMVGMFSTLLDLARIQAGAVQPEIEAVPLQEVIDRIVAEHPGSQVEAAHTPFAVRTDPLLLERMLRNLVSNALKHGGGKARITVEADGDLVEISVADDGPGIAPEDQARIFDEFVRLEGRAEGLGLGLAIVKRIADLLEAPIEVISAPGEGARFVVKLPQAVSSDAASEHSTASLSLNGSRILVVDDEQLARGAVARIFSDLGAETRTAGNEAEAEAVLAQGFSPGLLVMDLRIDGELAGIAIGGRLRRKISPAPQVIVVTGDTGPDALALLRASGYQWLIKPVNPRELAQAASEQLSSALTET